MKALIALLLLCTPLVAAEPSYLVKVQVSFNNGGEVDNGSGSLIGPDRVLTAWHNLRNYRIGNLQVVLSNGEVISATVIKKDRIPDLAVLQLARPTLVPFAKLAEEEPERRETVTAHGYPFGQEHKSITGQVGRRYAALRNGNPILFRISKRGFPGMSGGPVENSNGELCGVLFGSLGGAYATGIEAVHKFLEGTYAPLGLLR